MDTSKLTNNTLKQAFDAWQGGDSKTFLSFLHQMQNCMTMAIQEIFNDL
jgi:hypothetical protein